MNKEKDKHSCYYFEGKIRDVTFNNNSKTISCRRCGQELQEYEIDPQTLKEIKTIFMKR